MPLSKKTAESNILRERVLKTTRGLQRVTYAKSQEIIDEVIERRLSSIHFSMKPVYNTNIKVNGKVIVDNIWGKVKVFYIGKQEKSSEDFLVNTLLHEELEARIAYRALSLKAKKYQAMLNKDKSTHAYINSVIAKYFRMRGWK